VKIENVGEGGNEAWRRRKAEEIRYLKEERKGGGKASRRLVAKKASAVFCHRRNGERRKSKASGVAVSICLGGVASAVVFTGCRAVTAYATRTRTLRGDAK